MLVGLADRRFRYVGPVIRLTLERARLRANKTRGSLTLRSMKSCATSRAVRFKPRQRAAFPQWAESFH